MSFTTPHGITIPFPDRLAEGFEITPRSRGGFQLKVNVDASRLADVLLELAGLVPDPGFLVLETPCNEVREIELRKTDDDPNHRDVYYLDGLEQFRFQTIFSDWSDLLIHDGFVHFGYGSHFYLSFLNLTAISFSTNSLMR